MDDQTKSMAERHSGEIAAIIADHEAQTAIHRAHVGSDPAAKRAIVKIRAACSAAIRAACERHRAEANTAPVEAPEAQPEPPQAAPEEPAL